MEKQMVWKKDSYDDDDNHSNYCNDNDDDDDDDDQDDSAFFVPSRRIHFASLKLWLLIILSIGRPLRKDPFKETSNHH